MCVRRRVACLLSLSSLFFCSVATAAVVDVTSNADSGVGSLREAITQANANPDPSSITFAEGLGSIVLQSPLVITESITIDGGEDGQTISGGSATRLFEVPEDFILVSMSDLVLEAGFIEADAAASNEPVCSPIDGRGGAMCSDGFVSLERVTVRDSVATGVAASGGGLFLNRGGELVSSWVVGNMVSGDRNFSGVGAQGGGVATGAFNEANFDSAARLLVSGSLIENNSALGERGLGGGLYTPSGAILNMSSSAVINNDASFITGAMRVSLASISNSTISGNFAPRNGGLTIDISINLANPNLFLTPEIRFTTISDNQDTDAGASDGGALRTLFFNRDFTLAMDSVILADNTAASGNFESLLINNSGQGTVTHDVQNSIFGDDVAEINGVNSGNVFTDTPLLGSLSDQGCSSPAGAPGARVCAPVMPIINGSPAIDLGGDPGFSIFDQRGLGFDRVVGAEADAGAFEFGNGQPAAVVPVPSLNEFGLFLLTLIMAGAGLLLLRR